MKQREDISELGMCHTMSEFGWTIGCGGMDPHARHTGIGMGVRAVVACSCEVGERSGKSNLSHV